jgi:hypothetical protein
MVVWMNRILSNTTVGSTNGYRSSRPIERFTMFSAHASGSHLSMTVSNPLRPSPREERRALLEQRRAAVARQLRRLAIELADLDRQLDEIEQSER